MGTTSMPTTSTRLRAANASTSTTADDTTAGKTTSVQSTQNTKARDPLLAAICHDLRAPLAAVTMGANFVLTTTPEEEANTRSRRVLQAMLRSCKQMERLVRDFGDLSEIEGNAVTLRYGVHDVGAMLEMAAEASRAAASARDVKIAVDVPKELLLRCDRDRIMHALSHLIENAIRFAPEGTSVRVSAMPARDHDRCDRDDDIVMSVHDSGSGLSEETRDHLYDRMWHAKRADRVGAGLGLAIARGLVEAHGGGVNVDSRPGSTTFSLRVPSEAGGVSEAAVVFP